MAIESRADTQLEREGKAPFHFQSAVHILRVEPHRSGNLSEFLNTLKVCSQESIFQHTFRTLQEHHFLQEGYSNDFAHWALVACKEPELAERLSALDVREFTTLAGLRTRLVQIVDEHLVSNPSAATRRASEPFYFCSSGTVVLPTTVVARNLPEFTEAIARISVHSVHYHFIEARLRLRLNSNDFSVWLDREIGPNRAADLINDIDFYTLTLQGVRNRILRILEGALD